MISWLVGDEQMNAIFKKKQNVPSRSFKKRGKQDTEGSSHGCTMVKEHAK